jgi:hypothetical protein
VGKVNKRLYILLFFVFAVKLLQAQAGDTQFVAHKSSSSVDTTEAFVSPAMLSNAQFTPFVAQTDSLASSSSLLEEDSMKMAKQLRREQRALQRANFKPDPNMSLWLGLTFPGAAQIYNRKYWKLPIVYGGFVGCMYAFNWNGQMYKDYRQAYLDIMDTDPNTDSYKDFFRPGYDFDTNKEYVENVFKKRKDRYRRWRDLSIFATIAVYALSVVDAYVDAQLANFDISEDINLSIEPHIMNGGGHEFGKSNWISPKEGYYGLNCNITF